MKEAVNKAELAKTSSVEMTTKTKAQQTNKTETSRFLKLKEINRFHRFLEASCDCV